jgi:hypothetical protein
LLRANCRSPFAIGLLKHSVAIAIDRPRSKGCFDLINVEFGAGQLSAVTE